MKTKKIGFLLIAGFAMTSVPAHAEFASLWSGLSTDAQIAAALSEDMQLIQASTASALTAIQDYSEAAQPAYKISASGLKKQAASLISGAEANLKVALNNGNWNDQLYGSPSSMGIAQIGDYQSSVTGNHVANLQIAIQDLTTLESTIKLIKSNADLAAIQTLVVSQSQKLLSDINSSGAGVETRSAATQPGFWYLGSISPISRKASYMSYLPVTGFWGSFSSVVVATNNACDSIQAIFANPNSAPLALYLNGTTVIPEGSGPIEAISANCLAVYGTVDFYGVR